jgi:hypothetical protein
MQTRRQWIVAGVMVAVTTGGAATAMAGTGPSLGTSSVFRRPRAEAVGPAVGAVVAVNVFARFARRRRDDGRD